MTLPVTSPYSTAALKLKQKKKIYILRHCTFFELFIDIEPKSFLDYIFLCNHYRGFKREERFYDHSYMVVAYGSDIDEQRVMCFGRPSFVFRP